MENMHLGRVEKDAHTRVQDLGNILKEVGTDIKQMQTEEEGTVMTEQYTQVHSTHESMRARTHTHKQNPSLSLLKMEIKAIPTPSPQQSQRFNLIHATVSIIARKIMPLK